MTARSYWDAPASANVSAQMTLYSKFPITILALLVACVTTAAACGTIFVMLEGIVMLDSPVQPWNASDPMLVALEGIVTLVRRLLYLNAAPAMLITGKSEIITGVVTAPPAPVYPEMETA